MITRRNGFRRSAEAMLASLRNPPDDPGMSDEHDFFRLRRAAKAYISKVFTYGAHTRSTPPTAAAVVPRPVMH